jgi:hypothetical protein
MRNQMKDNLLIHPTEAKRRNKINLLMRMIDQILKIRLSLKPGNNGKSIKERKRND